MKSALYSAIIGAIISIALSGCISTGKTPGRNMVLSRGMSKSKAMELLEVAPASTVIKNGSEYLIYTEFNRAPSYLKFTNDKLAEWGIWTVMSDKL